MSPSHSTINDAREMFMQALRFDFSAGLLVDHANTASRSADDPIAVPVESDSANRRPKIQSPPTLAPSQFCEALSVELFLKTVLYLESVAVPLSSELDVLYSAIPRHWKDRIAQHFDRVVSTPQFRDVHRGAQQPVNIKEVLVAVSKNVSSWPYGSDRHSSSQFLTLATSAIYFAIIEGRPDWAHLRRDLCNTVSADTPCYFVLDRPSDGAPTAICPDSMVC